MSMKVHPVAKKEIDFHAFVNNPAVFRGLASQTATEH
jgi:hypothetical protein